MLANRSELRQYAGNRIQRRTFSTDRLALDSSRIFFYLVQDFRLSMTVNNPTPLDKDNEYGKKRLLKNNLQKSQRKEAMVKYTCKRLAKS